MGLQKAYTPISDALYALEPLKVAVFEGAGCPGHGWFWAKGNKWGRKFAYHKLHNGQVAILRLK